MDSTQNPFFDLENFNTVEFIIEGTNSTSQIKIPGSPSSIELIEIFEDGILIALPPRCCAIGHTLSLTITAKKIIPGNGPIEMQMHISGVVETLESAHARIRFRQYTKDKWDKLLKGISEAQFNLNELIKNTRK